jgi:hypothetical protein
MIVCESLRITSLKLIIRKTVALTIHEGSNTFESVNL